LTPDAIPYSLSFDFDKTLVGFVLLLWGVERCHSLSCWKEVLRSLLYAIPLTLVVVITAGFFLGYVRLDAKLPPITPLWMAANLLVTCTAEEAFFRGFVQKQLQLAFAKMKYGRFVALFAASLLFGLAHYAGGWKYVLLAA